MKYTLMFSALAVVMAATPVKAQPVAADLLPAYEVATIVSSMGLRPVGRPAWMRGRYVVAAIDRYGREVNVVLDARDGQVLAVQPLGRGGFGPPPPGYGRPGPYDPTDGRAPPPGSGPGAPPVDDDEFFDNDQQQGSLPPRAPARVAMPPREPSNAGRVTRNVPAVRRDGAPTPRPRPSLAKANDSGAVPAKPADTPAAAIAPAGQTPEVAKDAAKPVAAKDPVTPNVAKPDAAKNGASKPGPAKPETNQASAPQSAKPQPGKPEAGKEAAAKKPGTAQRDIRVIDLSKPKDSAQPADKPGEAIRF